MLNEYVEVADTLTDRILKLIPDNPSILDMDDAWGLFKVEGFESNDLQPSLYQASFALAKAKQLYKEREL